jgi:hypothetical protein
LWDVSWKSVDTDNDQEATSVVKCRQYRWIATSQRIIVSSHSAFPLPMWIPTLPSRGWVKTILSYSDGTGLGIMNHYIWWLRQS